MLYFTVLHDLVIAMVSNQRVLIQHFEVIYLCAVTKRNWPDWNLLRQKRSTSSTTWRGVKWNSWKTSSSGGQSKWANQNSSLYMIQSS